MGKEHGDLQLGRQDGGASKGKVCANTRKWALRRDVSSMSRSCSLIWERVGRSCAGVTSAGTLMFSESRVSCRGSGVPDNMVLVEFVLGVRAGTGPVEGFP